MSIDVGLEFVLNQLAEILKNNYELIKNLDKNIEALDTELRFLRSLVKDFQNQDHNTNYVKALVKEIKTIIWQSEDVVESFALELTSYKSSRSVVSKLTNNRAWARWKKAGDVTSIIAKIKQIKNDHVPYALQSEGSSGSTSTRYPEPYFNEAPVVEENNVVGFEGAIKDVEKLIHEGDNQLEIVTIVGMLGLGKTTLANKVFINPVNVDKFMIRAFVYVSKVYSKRDVFIQILRSFTQVSEDVKQMRLQELQSHVRKELEKTPYLIVLDDVWDTKAWEDLRDAFPMNSNVRCRVLITTRNEDVAKHANGDCEPYRLDFLTITKSRELLCRRVFGTETCPRKDLVESEATIATKCSGLPLSIVVIAGILLNHKDDVEFWKEVARHGKSIEEDEEKIKQMTDVVELMYKHLPDHLKQCFLYLGVFREDVEIPVWKVVRLWIAEGFVQSRENVKLEDMKVEDWAEACLQQLISRNLVIVVKKRTNDNKIKSVRIHDTLRDFCKAKAKEEGVFHEITDGKQGLGLNKIQSLSDCRRLFINHGAGTEKFISKAASFEYVRSFLSFSSDTIPVEAKDIARLPKSFKVLRVLEIKPLIFTLFPSKIRELTLIKYICISLAVREIPSSFSGLVHMQTLIVYTTSTTGLEIKADIWKMPHFRHLHTNVPTILPTPKKDDKGGDDVQTLTTISPQSCTSEVFKRVRNIRKLGIRGNLAEIMSGGSNSSVLDRLCDFQSLESLKLHNDQTCQLTALPSHHNFPKKLTKITLINTRLAWGEMSKLGQLEKLMVLKLKKFAFQGPVWNTVDHDFPSLKHLHIGHTDLTSWKVSSPDHFPQLKTLILDNCENLEALPAQVGAINCLRSVSLRYTNAQLVASSRELFPNNTIPVELIILG